MKKKHSTVKVVLIILLVFMLLTWILPVASFQGQYSEQGRVQMGIFDLFAYPTTAMSYFGYISLFLLVVGGFYGVLSKIGAYRSLLDKLANSFKKKGKLVISVIMVLIAVITSICGLQLGLFVFYPFIVALILLMGYDKIVAALTLVGSSMIGVAGTTYAANNLNTIMSSLSLNITSNLLIKVCILVLGLIVLIVNTVMYINLLEKKKKVTAIKKEDDEVKEEKKETVVRKAPVKKATKSTTAKKTTKSSSAKKTTSKKKTTLAAAKVSEVLKVSISEEDDKLVPEASSKKSNVCPLVVVFLLMFVVTILSFISWNGAFEVKLFDDITENVTKFKVYDFAIFAKILGNINAFGNWGLNELITVILLATGLLMIIYKVKLSEGIDAFAEGAKKAIQPAVLVVLIYTGLVITTYHPFQLVIYKFLFGFTNGFNIITSMLAAVLASVFNADPLYAFQSVLPYLASLVSKKSTLAVAGVVYQSMYGFTMLFAPTSVVLMTVLSYLGVSYKEWLKNIWKLLLELFIVLLLVFIILVLV